VPSLRSVIWASPVQAPGLQVPPPAGHKAPLVQQRGLPLDMLRTQRTLHTPHILDMPQMPIMPPLPDKPAPREAPRWRSMVQE